MAAPWRLNCRIAVFYSGLLGAKSGAFGLHCPVLSLRAFLMDGPGLPCLRGHQLKQLFLQVSAREELVQVIDYGSHKQQAGTRHWSCFLLLYQDEQRCYLSVQSPWEGEFDAKPAETHHPQETAETLVPASLLEGGGEPCPEMDCRLHHPCQPPWR